MPETHHAIPPPPSHAPTEAPAEMHEVGSLAAALVRAVACVPELAWGRCIVAAEARDRDESVCLTVTPVRCPCPHCIQEPRR